MKKSAIIFFLTLCMQLQSQEIYWDPEVVKNNKVSKAMIYWEVPKTNPEYFTEPIGLMLMTEISFDEAGRIIREFHPNGMGAFHGPSYDLIRTYSYTNGKLTKMRKPRWTQSMLSIIMMTPVTS